MLPWTLDHSRLIAAYLAGNRVDAGSRRGDEITDRWLTRAERFNGPVCRPVVCAWCAVKFTSMRSGAWWYASKGEKLHYDHSCLRVRRWPNADRDVVHRLEARALYCALWRRFEKRSPYRHAFPWPKNDWLDVYLCSSPCALAWGREQAAKVIGKRASRIILAAVARVRKHNREREKTT